MGLDERTLDLIEIGFWTLSLCLHVATLWSLRDAKPTESIRANFRCGACGGVIERMEPVAKWGA